MADEEWVKAAMADDSMVVELLVHLHRAPPPKKHSGTPAVPLEWSVRQRRSKHVTFQGKKLTARASPTTPLSWSGGTSGGGSCGGGGGVGTVDGYEESSQPRPRASDLSRSKVAGTSETTPTKRSRKKKTLNELKEDEVLLLKERRHLKRELVTLRITLEKQRATNESLKRIKLELQTQQAAEVVTTVPSEEATPGQTQQKVATSNVIPLILAPNVAANDHDASPKLSQSNSCSELQNEVTVQETKFVLPDLNLPLEEGPSSELLHGMSQNDHE